MKAIVTGMNGTVAPYVGRALEVEGFSVHPWDRSRHPTEDRDSGRRFLDDVEPDWLMHIGMGPADWAGFLAETCAQRGIRFLFTSTVSVYADRESGPITIETPPDSTSEYALYKLDCEQRIREANPEAVIARISWQIGAETGTNNMYAQLVETHARTGEIAASTRWFPACATLADTAAGLHRLRAAGSPGTYLLDSNAKWSYYQVVSALNRLHGSPWVVRPVETPVLDLRMIDPRAGMPPLESRLPLED